MIKHEASIKFDGDLKSAMAMAKNIFATNGFKLNENDQAALSLIGPGMNSTKQNPIRGISRGELKFTESTLEFSGELGGVEFMKKFLIFFPLALGIGITIVFVILTYFTKQNFPSAFIPLLAIAPWIFISPIIIKNIQKKTEEAIQTTLCNIVKA